MLDIKELGFVHLGVSTTYKTLVGKLQASDSVIIAPDADQEKVSICPGVSKIIKSRFSFEFSKEITS